MVVEVTQTSEILLDEEMENNLILSVLIGQEAETLRKSTPHANIVYLNRLYC